ncbi:MAG: DUF5688 family protein [Lachnospiraceae bacterium]|nr:DUF5688 family protein [Lachnospiraceae bacterium]
MTIDEFAMKVKNALFKEGEEREIKINKVLKNNGICLTGICIPDEEHKMTPTVYLDEYLAEYEEGTPFATVIREIKRLASYHDDDISFDLKSFTSFSTARDRIVYKLINARMNEQLLKEVPHETYLDMAKVFYYVLSDQGEKQASILIYNGHMAGWGIDTATLSEYANVNTPRLLPGNICSMNELISKMVPGQAACVPLLREEDDLMYVLTNVRKYFGAACMLYEGVLGEFADRIGGSFYILPSSVHEVILLRETGDEDPYELVHMVNEVNESQVAADEVLSGSVYRYDRKTAEISVFDRNPAEACSYS